MNNYKTIAIIFGEYSRPKSWKNYRIWHLAQEWVKYGLKVQMVRGANNKIDAEMLIPQVDMSVLPKSYHHHLRSKAVVINRKVIDIRKTFYSQNLVTKDDEYQGAVIVKTTANCGGVPEKKIARRSSFFRRVFHRLERMVNVLQKIALSGSLNELVYVNSLPPSQYPVFSSKDKLPKGVFANNDLVVEKFLPERDGELYCLRSYTFFGSEEFAVRSKSKFPVVKGENSFSLEFVPIDKEIAAMREQLGFDYGKFDYVLHDGEAILLDINTTPTFGLSYPTEIRLEIAEKLAKGIYKWFPL